MARLPMSHNFGADPRVEEARQLRNTIWRIASYPMVHLFLGLVGPIASLILNAKENHVYQLVLYYISFIGVGWIPLGYALCILFADVSLCEGLKAWANLRRHVKAEDPECPLVEGQLRWAEVDLEVQCSSSVIPVSSKSPTMKDAESASNQSSIDFLLARSKIDTIREESLQFED